MGGVTDSEIAMDGPAASFGMLAAVAAKQNVGERVCVKEPFAFKVIVPRLHVRVEARVDGIKETLRVLDDVEGPPKRRKTAVDAPDDEVSYAKANE